MTGGYQLTFADYCEAGAASAVARRTGWDWAGLAVAVALLAVAVWQARPRPTGFGLAAVAVDGATVGLLIALSLPRSARPPADPFVDLRRRVGRRVSLTLTSQLIAGLAVAASSVHLEAGGERYSTPVRILGTILGLLPGLAVIALVGSGWLIALWSRRRSFARRPHLSLPTRMAVTSSDLTLDQEVGRTVLVPAGIVQCIETPNLLLLCMSADDYVIIPKRAFGAPATVGEFRHIVRTWATTRTAAFPIPQDL